MATWTTLKAAIQAVIKQNGNQEITGDLLQDVLVNMVESLGLNATFAGVASTSTSPGAPDGPVFWLASGPGTYSNFAGVIVPTGYLGVLIWDGSSWSLKTISLETTFDKVTDNNGTDLNQSLTNLENKLYCGLATYQNDDYDLAFTDYDGNVLVGFAKGHMRVKGFDTLNFAGVADTNTTPNTAGGPVVYLAGQGSYDNFGSTKTVPWGYIGVFVWNGASWTLGTVRLTAVTTYIHNYDGTMTLDEILEQLSKDIEKNYCGLATYQNDDYDLAFTDYDGNVLVGFSEGEAKTKNFDSRTTPSIEDNDDGDLSFKDEEGNELVRFADGHVKTKNFDSSNIETADCGLATSDMAQGDLAIIDEDANCVALFSEGGLETKEFDTKTTPKIVNDEEADLSFCDDKGRVLARFFDGHVKTKNFDSSTINVNADGSVSEKPLVGKVFSLIGDSISTYEGWLPGGYSVYYPRGTVDSVDKTWWKMLVDETGMTMGQNCAWSGSKVTGNGASTTSASAGCSTARVNDLALNGTPDIVVIFIGINDFGATVTPIGDWTAKDPYPEDGTKSTFSEAYALMLSKVISTYPKAQVFCCTLLLSGQANKDPIDTDVYPTENEGYTLDMYNDVIRNISVGYGCPVIELCTCGIRFGSFDYYTIDKLHPNYDGMVLMKNIIKKSILMYYDV